MSTLKINKKSNLTFGAIDIGTNAIRLLIQRNRKRLCFLRIPIRLGNDVFSNGLIGPSTASDFLKAMLAFKYLIEINQVSKTMICGTSALREAKNGFRITQWIKEKTGLQIEIISGQKEAELLYETHIADHLNPKKNYLYVDIGGGSTEVTLFSGHKPKMSASFQIGTIRLLKKKVLKSHWFELENFISKALGESKKELIAIGTGGNMQKLVELAKGSKQITSSKKIEIIAKKLKKLSINQRIQKFNLKSDRADVIVPASEIMLFILKLAKIKKLIAPDVGLVDGMISTLNS
jgi:exopolyphosphatase/guanosine-5'-triphosphate,3'-diphosphate pyrophosphatase